MKVTAIEWDATNRKHFRDHGRCREREVADVLLSVCYRSRFKQEKRPKKAEPRIRVEGQTCDERFLTVIARPKPERVLRPVTCFPPSDHNIISYLSWRQAVKGR